LAPSGIEGTILQNNFHSTGVQVQMLLADLRLALRVILDAALPILFHLPGRAVEDLQPATGLHHSGKAAYSIW